METYRDLLEFLNTLPPEQLDQVIMIKDLNDVIWAFSLSSVYEKQNAKDKGDLYLKMIG